MLYFILINKQYGHSLKTFQGKYSEQFLDCGKLLDLIKALDAFPKKMNIFTTFCKHAQAVSPWTNSMNKFHAPKYGIKQSFDLIYSYLSKLTCHSPILF